MKKLVAIASLLAVALSFGSPALAASGGFCRSIDRSASVCE